MCMFVTILINDRVLTIPRDIRCAVANPVRDLLDRKTSEGHIQSSNELIETNI